MMTPDLFSEETETSKVEPKVTEKRKKKPVEPKKKEQEKKLPYDNSRLEVYTPTVSYSDIPKKDGEFHQSVQEVIHYFQTLRDIISESEFNQNEMEIDLFKDQISAIFDCYAKYKNRRYSLKLSGDWSEAKISDLKEIYIKLANEMNYRFGILLVEENI